MRSHDTGVGGDMTRKPVFAVLGSGMQGTAAAYDLARFSGAEQIRMGDRSFEQARSAADRVHSLVDRDVCRAYEADALEPESLALLLDGVDCVLSCVPYWMHPHVAQAALANRCNMVDLGGNTEITRKTLALDAQAKEAGVSLIPDTGLAPGLVNSIGLALIESMEEVESVKLFCGVLPQDPKPPFNYKLTFNVEGLVTEYDHKAIVLRDGRVQEVDTLQEIEWVNVDELGRLEAFTTSGGTSTAPYTFEGKLRNYEYKTLRYPGHCALMRLFKDFGFWSEEPVAVKNVEIRPKDAFCAVFGPKLAEYEDKDLCVIRGVAHGKRDGVLTMMQVDILDKECPETGFTAMERLTGFSCSIMAQAAAAGETPRGAVRYECALGGREFLQRLRRRGVDVRAKTMSEVEFV